MYFAKCCICLETMLEYYDKELIKDKCPWARQFSVGIEFTQENVAGASEVHSAIVAVLWSHGLQYQVNHAVNFTDFAFMHFVSMRTIFKLFESALYMFNSNIKKIAGN